MKKQLSLILLLVISSCLLHSCKKDNNDDDNPKSNAELILGKWNWKQTSGVEYENGVQTDSYVNTPASSGETMVMDYFSSSMVSTIWDNGTPLPADTSFYSIFSNKIVLDGDTADIQVLDANNFQIYFEYENTSGGVDYKDQITAAFTR